MSGWRLKLCHDSFFSKISSTSLFNTHPTFDAISYELQHLQINKTNAEINLLMDGQMDGCVDGDINGLKYNSISEKNKYIQGC